MNPLTILLIDDSETDRATYRRFLSQPGQSAYHWVEFDLAANALTWCQTHQPDVILLDYRLPDMDGLEFLAALQSQTGQTSFPLILLTAYSQIDLALEAMRQGAQDYLDKSRCTAAELQIRVQGVLERSRWQQTVTWQRERQRLVATLALKIRQSLALGDILQTTVVEVRSLLDSDRVMIYQFSPDWSGQVVAEAVGADWTPILGAVIDDPCLEYGWAERYRQGHFTHHANIQTEGLADCYVELLQRFQVQANLVIPILQDQQLWGCLIVHQCRQPRQWQETEIELLQDLATQLAIAITQADIHTQLQRQHHQEQSNRQQTEIRFQAMFDQSPEAQIRFTPDGWVIAANPAWEAVWEAPATILNGYNILHDPAVITDGNLPGVLRAFAGEQVSFPIFCHNPRQFGHVGRSRWIDTLMYPITDPTGHILEVVMVVRDVTDRMTAQNDQQRLVRLIEHSPNGVGTATLDGHVTFINQAGQTLLGITAVQMNQTTIWDYHTPEEKHWLQSQVLPIVLETGQWQGELTIRHYQTGERIPAWCNLFTLTQPQTGQPEALALVWQDLRDQKRAEQALRENEEKLRLCIRHAPAGIAMLDREMCYITASQQWVNDFQLDAVESLIGRSHYEVFPDLPEHWRQVHQRCLAGATERCEEDVFVRADGRQQWTSWEICPWYTHRATIGGIIIFTKDITAWKEAEQARCMSEARLRAIFDNTFQFIGLLTPTGMLLETNQAALDFGGLQAADVINRPLWETYWWTISPQTQAQLQAAIHRAAQGELVRYEVAVLGAGNRVATIDFSLKPMRDETGQVILLIPEGRDITEQKAIRDALYTSEARLRLAQAASNAGVWDWQIPTQSLFWSPECYQLFQLDPGIEPTYDQWLACLYPDDREPIHQQTLRILASDRVEFRLEYRVIQELEVRWFASIGQVFRDAARAAIRIIGITLDITQSKQTELALQTLNTQLEQRVLERTTELHALTDRLVLALAEQQQIQTALRESEERLRFALEAAHMGNWDWNLLTNEIIWSKSLERLMGMEPGTFDGTMSTVSNMVDPADRQRVLAAITRSIEQGEDYDVEFRFVKPDGSVRWVASKGNVQRDAAGRAERMAGIDMDITDRKQAEQALAEAKVAAEAASRAKSTFLANMSHELRTPLNAILGFTQLLQRRSQLAASDRDQLNLIYTSGTYLLKLINEILDLAKIEAGKVALSEQPIDLVEQLQTICNLVNESVSRKRLYLQLDIAPAVPQFIVVDAQKLEQILLNLLSNAIKFTAQGGILLCVNRAASRRGNSATPHATAADSWSLDEPEHLIEPEKSETPAITLRFEVKDTGIGIAPTDLHRIFDAFAQTSAGQQTTEGTGLGLTISQRLAQYLGGDITVQSVLGQGSTFTLTLPVQPVTRTTDPAPPLQHQTVQLALQQPETYRLLVVDDQDANRCLLRQLLEPVGLTIREATTGEAALEIWQQWYPHLIWLDIRLPGSDGYEVTRRIRASEQQRQGEGRESGSDGEQSNPDRAALAPTVIIALTAQAFPEDRALALAAGCNDYLAKPFQEADLLRKLAEHLNIPLLQPEPSGITPEAEAPIEPTSIATQLAVMPQAWVTALYEAAVMCQAEAVQQLLQQIPPEHSTLTRQLDTLVYHFDFQTIMDLTTTALDSQST